MHIYEATFHSHRIGSRQQTLGTGHSVGPTEKVGHPMNLARKIGITVAATALSLGLLGVSAPAQAVRDSSWGCGGYCRVAR